MVDEPEELSQTTPEEVSHRFNIRAPHLDSDTESSATVVQGFREEDVRRHERHDSRPVKDIFGLLPGITPDRLFNTILGGVNNVLVVGLSESSKAVNRMFSGSNDRLPPPPPPSGKGPSR